MSRNSGPRNSRPRDTWSTRKARFGSVAQTFRSAWGRAEALRYIWGRAEALRYIWGRAKALRYIFAALAILLAGCEREARRYQELPASANRETGVRVSQLEPGMPQVAAPVKSPYQDNAWGMGEGKRLYGAYNCAPCHGVNGGGAIGPPLIDDKWIYGAAPDQIYATISQGRPDGMPSFGGHITTQQIWQLVSYVEAMSGQVKATSAPSRNDDQMGALPESRQSKQVPVQTGHR